MNKNKYRFWCGAAKGFITNYNYNGAVDELFDDHILRPQQFIGILDAKMVEIYEGDVVRGKYGLEGIDVLGEVRYSYDWCSYFIGDHQICDLEFDSLEIVGNMMKDYIYDTSGELVTRGEYEKNYI